MARAIVTFGRSWQALAIVRSLGRQGIEVFVGEEAPFAPCFFSKYCSGSFQHPSFNSEPDAFIDFMVDKVAELAPGGDEPYVLIPVHKETWLYARHRERFEPHVRLCLAPYDKLVSVHDKGQLPDLAGELGIQIPPTFRFATVDEVYARAPTLPYPLFVKLRESAAGVGIAKVDTPEELTGTFRAFVEGYELTPEHYPLVQGFVAGDDYCVTALFDHGRCVANMTYHNVRAFPRTTGAGSLREAVSFPAAEREAVRLLEHLDWHGIAELDFRGDPDGEAYLIEVNPRFFGGLPQAVAANVDYPHLLFRVAAGEQVETPEVDYSRRTEAPITGLLATLDEIAHDDALLDRFRAVRSELGQVMHADIRDVRLTPFWDALRSAANPRDLKSYLAGMFEKHQNTINDVLQRDDPLPAMGVLYPVALMLKHGKLSMGLLTGEDELDAPRERRSLRGLLRHPTPALVLLTGALYGLTSIAVSWAATASNVAWALAWPALLLVPPDASTLAGALRIGAGQLATLAYLYLLGAALLRQSRTLFETADD